MVYGVVGAGEMPYEQIKMHLKKQHLVWRRECDHWELYSYRKNCWVEMIKDCYTPAEMMVLAGL
jgi:hypothetical protein